MTDEKTDDRLPGERESAELGELDDTMVEILSIGEEGEEPAAEPPATIASEEVRRLAGELASANERYLRLRADFDNFRKRVERERSEIGRYALIEPLRDLLPLRRLGLAAVPAVGSRFDPSVHEAVSQEESEAVAVPTVVAELQRGYRLHERLLRPALVRVAMPQEGAPGEPPGEMPENLPQA